MLERDLNLEFQAGKLSAAYAFDYVLIYDKNKELKRNIDQIRKKMLLLNYLPGFFFKSSNRKYIDLNHLLRAMIENVVDNHKKLMQFQLEFDTKLAELEHEVSTLDEEYRNQKMRMIEEYKKYQRILDTQIKESFILLNDLKDDELIRNYNEIMDIE